MHGGRGNKVLIVVKLGGSVITDKKRAFIPRLTVIKRLALILKTIKNQGYDLIVVLGGGSYGHAAVASINASNGSAMEALSITSTVMIELALLVVDIFQSVGLWSIIYSPHSMCRPRGLKPNCVWDILKEALSIGAVPIVYGDVYPSKEGFSIISGDELAMEAACMLGAKRVVYVSNVSGVLDNRGNPIPLIKSSLIPSILEMKPLTVSSNNVQLDVTGGMKRKLMAIYENICEGIEALIVGYSNLKEASDLLAPKTCTRILP